MQNPWHHLKQEIAKKLGIEESGIEEPKEGFGDFAYPCFNLAKKERKDPKEIAEKIAKTFKLNFIKEARAIGPYVNFYVNWPVFAEGLLKSMNKKYGSSDIGRGKTVIVEYSDPNIAKPMHVGHLRSTIIGQSLYNIYKFLGYKCISWNYIGDWGTQFGKVIVAYKKWGSKQKLKKDSIKELFRLYVKFHEEVKNNSKLEDEAREWVKKLEGENKEALNLWKQFTELSRKELEKTYKILNIKFDLYTGESFFNKMAKKSIVEAVEKGVATRDSDGAIIVDLSNYNMPPYLIQKSDEATLYSTRDIALIKYRYEKYKFYKNIYVVGSEQKLHFQQLFKTCELLGVKGVENSVHVDYGLMSLPKGKLSTREGKVIFLEDLINEAIDLARKIVNKKNPKLSKSKKDAVAETVGIGSIKFNDLSNDRINNIVFDWKKMLTIEGKSAPYIQYTYARAVSILRKAKTKPTGKILLREPLEESILKKIAQFPEIVERSAKEFKPHYIANYCFELAEMFNMFYQKFRVLDTEKGLRNSRLKLVESVKTVLKTGLNLLGIDVLEEM
jgi:arginyl-tRNA synthetase